MTTYTKDSTAVTFFSGTTFTSGSPNDTYVTRRGFMRFDTSTISRVRTKKAALLLNVTAVSGGTQNHTIRTDAATGWGTTLDATQADFESTTTAAGDDVSITSNAKYRFRIPKAQLNYSGTTWFKLKKSNESEAATKTIRVSSQNNATPANRPALEVVYKTPKYLRVSNKRFGRW